MSAKNWTEKLLMNVDGRFRHDGFYSAMMKHIFCNSS